MRRHLLWIALGISSVTSLACGGTDSHSHTDSDGSMGDGAVTVDGGSDAGQLTMDAGTPAVVNAQGVLTAFPHLNFSITTGYKIVSANFTFKNTSVEPYFEIQNTGATVRCDFLPSFKLDGVDLLGQIRGAPYYSNGSTVTSPCIAPGEIGVLTGIANNVTASTVANATNVTVDPKPFVAGPYVASTDGPLLASPTIGNVSAGGTGLSGSLTIQLTVHNYALRVYPRDSRGLLYDELLAFPNSLGTLSVGSSVPFATDGNPLPFATYLSFGSWIKG